MSIAIPALKQKSFNERAIYKYVGKVKGTNTGRCSPGGLANMGSCYYSIN